MIADLLPWIVAGISLLVVFAAVIVSARGERQLRVAHEQSIAAKNEQIVTLETQLTSLRESESIRFVDRYVAAKRGLEERTAKLHEQLEKTREQQDQLRAAVTDLGLSDRERETETERLRRDLHRTTDQIRRLELVLREVASVGPMDVETIRIELESRRELSTHIRERLDRLSLEEQDRMAARRSQSQKLERLHDEAARVRRDIEITRAAASIVDGILGIDNETRRRLARHASEQIEGALQSLGDVARRDPLSHFVDVFDKQRPDRLLEKGNPPPPAPEEPAAAAPAPEPETVRAAPRETAGTDRALGPYWTAVP